MQSTCLVEGCEKPQRSRRLCRAHYMEHWKNGTLAQFAVKDFVTHPCIVDGCARPARRLHSGPCNMHYTRLRLRGDYGDAEPERLIGASIVERLEFRRSINPTTGCWEWLGCRVDGYGTIGVSDAVLQVHRVSYEEYVGPIPEGFHIDHLCRNRACFNPQHLEPVTQAENNRRAGLHKYKQFCIRGHELKDPNLYYRRNGTRACKACDRARNRNRARSVEDSRGGHV